MPDHFPTTRRTLLGRMLRAGETSRDELNRFIMEVYAEPLIIYLRGHSGAHLADPREIVHAFLADRLAREDFIARWEESGLRLRRWLMNGLNFYLKEWRANEARHAREGSFGDYDPLDAEQPDQDVDRAFARQIVRRALHDAKRACLARGLGLNWSVFVRHYYDGLAYQDLANEYDVTPARAAVMARTAARRFRAALQDLLSKDGATHSELDREIQTLVEVVAQ